MKNRLISLAIFAAATAGMSGAALAQVCPPGYILQAGACYAAPATPGGVVAGAGAIVGGALNTAGAIAGGAANTAGAVVGGAVGAVAPACPPGLVLYADRCYPAR